MEACISLAFFEYCFLKLQTHSLLIAAVLILGWGSSSQVQERTCMRRSMAKPATLTAGFGQKNYLPPSQASEKHVLHSLLTAAWSSG